MLEDVFYSICEKLENAELPTEFNGYYPTIEELEESIGGRPIDKFMPIIIYYASDPLKDKCDDEEYKELVLYAKNLTSMIELE